MPELLKEWLAAGLSNALTSALLNPFDVVKTRIQQYPKESDSSGLFRKTLRHLYIEGGVIGLYSPGLVASVTREMINSGIRSGLYVPVRNKILTATNSNDSNNLAIKILSAISTGILGSLAANPIDVIKVRLMTKPNNSTIGLMKLIAKNEGINGFYKGLTASTLRAASISVGELACYDFAKHYLKDKYEIKEGLLLHTIASLITGVSAATFASPFDVIKTRAMNSETKISTAEIVMNLLKREGPSALLSGWLPSYLRLAPHALIAFPLFENFRSVLGLDCI